MSFPVSPVNGQTTSTNGIVYTYSSTNAAWTRTPGTTAAGIGVGQTWQTVTRTNGTTYYNTTGKPIGLALYATSGANTSYQIAVDGVGVSDSRIAPSNGDPSSDFTIIPAGSRYVITATGSYANAELR